jgi:predicted nucleic acid-binding protein
MQRWIRGGISGQVRSTAMLCMSDEPFTLDTNILVYCVDRQAGDRHEISKQIIRDASRKSCHLTAQSISEFYVVVTRKRMMPPASAAQFANNMIEVFGVVTASAEAVRVALTTAASGKASYWDTLLIATAAESGCTTILTEDLTDGTLLHGVRICNPFAGSNLAPEAAILLAD